MPLSRKLHWRTKGEADEMPLEASPFFLARLEQIKETPTLATKMLEMGNQRLLDHLRATANRHEQAAMKAMRAGATRQEAVEAGLAAVLEAESPEASNQRLMQMESQLPPDQLAKIQRFKTWMRQQPKTFVT